MRVFAENQVHGRSDPGSRVAESLIRLVDAAEPGELLAGVHRHADTMFNVAQIARISSETTTVLARRPELLAEVNRLREFLYQVERARGYIWISGD